MPRFPITEARARFCFHPGVTHTVMSERRAAQLLQAHAAAECKRGGIPINREGSGKEKLIHEHVVLPMLDGGMSIARIAEDLGVSASSIHDRVRLWRPMRRKRRKT